MGLLEEIASACSSLKQWTILHPAEEGMSNAFEQLSLLEDVALGEIDETERASAQFEQQRLSVRQTIDGGVQSTSGRIV